MQCIIKKFVKGNSWFLDIFKLQVD